MDVYALSLASYSDSKSINQPQQSFFQHETNEIDTRQKIEKTALHYAMVEIGKYERICTLCSLLILSFYIENITVILRYEATHGHAE